MFSFLKKVKAALKKEMDYYFPWPRSATLALTERCNLKCRSCGVWQKPARKDDELDTDTIHKVLRELKRMGVQTVYLIEGEPLLRFDIVDIIEQITDLGMSSQITTNGVLLKKGDRARELVQAGLNSITVSIDAPNEVHDSLRGVKGAFQRAVAGVRLLTAARDSIGKSSPYISINCVLSSENIGFLDEWLDFACGLSVDGLNLGFPTFIPDGVDKAAEISGEKVSSGRFDSFDKKLIIGNDLIPDILNKLKAIRMEGMKRGIKVWLAPDIYLSNPKSFETGIVPIRKCYFIRNHIIVDQYGGIMPCALMDKYSYGSVLEESIRDIWLNNRHRALMKKVDNGMQICKYCRCHFGNNLTLFQQIKRTMQSI